MEQRTPLGPAATAVQTLLRGLPPAEAAFLQRPGLRVLHWGAGEAAVALAAALPAAQVSATDTPNGADFDAVISLDVLPLAAEPLGVLEEQLRHAGLLCVATVPLNEHPLAAGHRTQFREESFPGELGAHRRIAAHAVEAEEAPTLVVTYASPSYLRESAGAVDDERAAWERVGDAEPAAVEGAGRQAFGAELATLVGELVPLDAAVLDAGCGGGWQSIALAREGFRSLTCLDVSASALQRARAAFAEAQLAATFVEEDVFALPPSPEHDLVFSVGSIEHYPLDRQAAFLRGLAARSRRYVVVIWPNPRCYWYWVWRLQTATDGGWGFGREVPGGDLGPVADAAGLTLLGQRPLGAAWAEHFITGLPGLSAELARTLLRLHRSPVIPLEQRAYLNAALLTVDPTATAPDGWDAVAADGAAHTDLLTSAVVDALAEATAARHQLEAQQAALAQQRAGANLEEVAQATSRAEAAERAAARADATIATLRLRLQRAVEHANDGSRDTAPDVLRRELDELRGELAAREAEVAELRAWIDTIHQSRSWKLTRPLRALGGS
jgi:SAM-dependent methyltransferase